TRRDEQRRFALALEQRVGRDRRSHLHALDLLGCDRLVGAQPEQVADAGNRRIAVLLGVLGQQLVGDEAAVGALADQVGEGAAAVDPELPAGSRVHEALQSNREADRAAISVVRSCTAQPVAARTASAYGGRLVHSSTMA